MKQLVQACHAFAADNKGCLPPNYIWEGFYPEIALNPDRVATGLFVLAWTDLIRPYVGSDNVFSCASLRTTATTGYGGIRSDQHSLGIGLNFNTIGNTPGNPADLWKVIGVANPSKVVVFADAGGGDFSTGDFKTRKDTPGCGSAILRGNTETADQLMPRHRGKANIAFLDGHVQLLDPAEIDWGERNPSSSAVGWADATWQQ
jgi:prepilin-type processing-associated H-X9-DG protein